MRTKILSSIFAVTAIMLFMACSCDSSNKDITDKFKIGIAWRADLDSEFYTNIVAAVKAVGATPVLLGQVRANDLVYFNDVLSSDNVDENDILRPTQAEKVKSNTYTNSNIADVMKDVDGVIFTGGEDICPTLYSIPEQWHNIAEEKDYNATRDVSDYLLMAYCIDKNISVIGLCRGMQMLSVVSGATVIQDIPKYFSEKGEVYDYSHRNTKVGDTYRDYAPHKVVVDNKSSILYKMVGVDMIDNVPSWHHQSVKSVDGTKLQITGFTSTCGENVIEAVERVDKDFLMGLQFHPEAAIVKTITNAPNKNNYMAYETAIKMFDTFVQNCKKQKK